MSRCCFDPAPMLFTYLADTKASILLEDSHWLTVCQRSQVHDTVAYNGISTVFSTHLCMPLPGRSEEWMDGFVVYEA